MAKYEKLSEIMDGYNPQRALIEQTRKLVDKWEPTGLLEGIDDETKSHGMAVLLENQEYLVVKRTFDQVQCPHLSGEAGKACFEVKAAPVGRIFPFMKRC